jgi:hypothetical protein
MHATNDSTRVRLTSEPHASGLSRTTLTVTAGPLGLAELTQLLNLATSLTPDQPVLLVSEYALVPQLTPPEEQTWILTAGEYRAWQHQFQAAGGKMASLVTDCAIGGTYLIHGLGTSVRLAYDHARFYPTLSEEAYVARFQKPYPHPTDIRMALETHLITHAIPATTSVSALTDLVIFLLHSHHA